MKICTKCNQEKPYDAFSPRPEMKDGYRSECKECRKEYYRQYEQANRERINTRHKIASRKKSNRLRQHNWRRSRHQDPEFRKAYNEKARLRYQREGSKVRARVAVYDAIQKRELSRLPCEKCGNLQAQAHHEDYRKQLDVQWLCSMHHTERHEELKALNIDIPY